MGPESEASLEATIGPSTAPAPSPDAAAVEVDGETVVFHEGTGDLHLLNRTASVIWWSLDGETSLEELSSELARAAGADLARVAADVVEAARDFARLRLLDDADPESLAAPQGTGEHIGSGPGDGDGDDGPRTVPVTGST